MREPTDITDYIKSFELLFDAGIRSQKPNKGEGYTYFWNLETPPRADVTLTIKPDDIPKLINLEGEQLVRLENNGKYWFDIRFAAYVSLTNLEIKKDGTITATYIGTNITDLTNKSYLARFLRWILRRAKGLL